MSTKRDVITVDGLAGTGKTTLSQLISEQLGFLHLSTGLLYRAVGYLALQSGVAPSDAAAVAELLELHQIKLVTPEGNSSARIALDEKLIFDELYTPDVSEATSEVAVHEAVRKALVLPQRTAFAGKHLVAEGRDMGTVIFPDAPVKFWVETPLDIKVERRVQQLDGAAKQRGDSLPTDIEREMRREIHDRDKRDQERGLAPTVRSNDMITIVNADKTLEEVLLEMKGHLSEHLSRVV